MRSSYSKSYKIEYKPTIPFFFIVLIVHKHEESNVDFKLLNKNITSNGVVVVGEYSRHAVKLVNGDSIKWGDFNKRLQISWPSSYFNTSDVDVDFVIFS